MACCAETKKAEREARIAKNKNARYHCENRAKKEPKM